MGYLFQKWQINNTSFEDYFNKPQENLKEYSPTLLKDFKKTIQRISQAIDNNERLMLFGDYDVDGTVGTAISYNLLSQLTNNISYRLPHREKDGYGLKPHLIPEMVEKQVDLLITIDNGITSFEAIDEANKHNIDVIIIDHHQVHQNGKLPSAYSIINHQQEECLYPSPNLCGAALAYKVGLGIAKNYFSVKKHQDWKTSNLDLVALATVADCVPLQNENKFLVKQGLEILKNTKNKGILEIAKLAKINLKEVNSETLGFQIGPRINAAGRLQHAYTALFTLTNKPQYAQDLEIINQDRKNLVKSYQEDFINHNFNNELIIEVNEKYHLGVIGIVAGKLCEQYHLPTIIGTKNGEYITASCRAPEGFNIFELLNENSDLLDHFGGHHQAAGLSIHQDQFPKFKEKIQKIAKNKLSKKPLEKQLNITCILSSEQLSLKTLEIINQHQPFGIGNPKPIFLIKNISPQWQLLGKDKDHLKGFLNDIEIIKFFHGNLIEKLQNQKINLACTLNKNTWNGNSKLQLELIDFEIL